MFACRQAEGKHSLCGALHNDNTAACETDVAETDADETEVRISWTSKAEV